MKNVCIYFLFLCFFSCTSKEGDLLSLVKEWEGKTIKFPGDTHLTVLGKDTLSPFGEIASYKLVNYTDSMGCISCKLQLTKWIHFIRELDSVSTKHVPVLFYMHPRSVKELLYYLKRDNFDYPVCIDENDELNRLNHFPSDMAFQTFLLDKDNKVLAMGNPILNPKIKELYLKIIRGNDIVSTAGKDITQTKVHIDVSFLRLGNFDWKEEQKAIFVLKNVGDKPLAIQDVTTSCGCTTVTYPKEPALPGKEIALEVVYKAEQPGHFDKMITVYCNAETSPLVLKISGDAK